jgi:hypothetical protein
VATPGKLNTPSSERSEASRAKSPVKLLANIHQPRHAIHTPTTCSYSSPLHRGLAPHRRSGPNRVRKNSRGHLQSYFDPAAHPVHTADITKIRRMGNRQTSISWGHPSIEHAKDLINTCWRPTVLHSSGSSMADTIDRVPRGLPANTLRHLVIRYGDRPNSKGSVFGR